MIASARNAPHSTPRLLAGFALAPISASVLAVGASLMLARLHVDVSLIAPFPSIDAELRAFIAWSLMLSVAVTLLAAVPIFLFKRAKGPISAFTCTTWGAILGCSPFILLGVAAICFAPYDRDLPRIGGVAAALAPYAALGATSGAFAAAVFFVVAVWQSSRVGNSQ